MWRQTLGGYRVGVSRNLRSGQEWRLSNGDEVIVQAIEGETVHGSLRMAATSPLGVSRGTVGLAAFVGAVSDFRNATLVGPRWRVRAFVPAPADHPLRDPVFKALNELVEIEHVSRPAVRAEQPQTVHANEAHYDLLVLAPTEGEAAQMVMDAVAATECGQAAIESVERLANQ